MRVDLAYQGRSGLAGGVLGFKPNLNREVVAFDGALRDPVRFREAISALHDVVISDLRFQKRDKEAYRQWKRSEDRRVAEIRTEATAAARAEADRKNGITPQLRKQFEQARHKYWKARRTYDAHLRRTDVALWRSLYPCDPVVTVGPDVVFFECFSSDESSYGCLTVDRDAFGTARGVQMGTTNVDYSWELYEGFQSLRSYRETRLHVDPSGFEVKTADAEDVREEKIDLPDGWLRGFMQLQATMTLPMRRVSLSREALYGVLAFLKRNKAKKSPRAIRFELLPGRAPALVLEPWEQRIVSDETVYEGPEGAPIRIWGRRRLLVLARLLPLIERCDVYLLGDGLPSFWVAHMRDMRLTLGLSGWTTNDWTRSSSLDLLAPPVEPSFESVQGAAAFLSRARVATLDEVQRHLACPLDVAAAALNRLAHTGQAIGDLAAGVYRWRQVMPYALGEEQLGPENHELRRARQMVANKEVEIQRREELPNGDLLVAGRVGGQYVAYDVEILLDRDGMLKRAKSKDPHHRRTGLRAGPSQFVLALRMAAQERSKTDGSTSEWYRRLQGWASN